MSNDDELAELIARHDRLREQHPDLAKRYPNLEAARERAVSYDIFGDPRVIANGGSTVGTFRRSDTTSDDRATTTTTSMVTAYDDRCEECGEPLDEDARYGTRFCSRRCRQRAWRKSQRASS